MMECYLEINAKNLIHNYNWYQSQSTTEFVCPMIKANAYGAGDKEVFKILRSAGADIFGVVRLSEAREIRSIDPDVKILLFNPCDAKDFNEVIALRLTPVISNLNSLEIFCKLLKQKGLVGYGVHIEIDTGMNRLGFKRDAFNLVFDVLRLQDQIKIEGVFSHFVQADDWPDALGRSAKQIKDFEHICEQFQNFLDSNPKIKKNEKLICHLSSSKALNDKAIASKANDKLTKFGLRPGLGLYGISQNNLNLKSVLSLKAPIVDLKWCKPGETVSYDGKWVVERPSLIGTLPLGYGDGFPRGLAGQTHVLIKGQKAPVVGNICMDFIMIDLTDLVFKSKDGDLSSIKASDLNESFKNEILNQWMSEVALVFGDKGLDKDLTIESLAEKSGLITYEFMVRLSPRIHRHIVEF